MENAADALKMAGAVLLFVLALSVIIFSFGQARANSDIILNYKDRETEYIDGNYYYTTSGTERQVSLETVIPAIYRAFFENYKIVFIGLKKPIYKIKNPSGELVNKYTIDLEKRTDSNFPNVAISGSASEEDKKKIIKAFLYGDYSDFSNNKSNFENKFHIKMDSSESIYDQLTKASKITEYLGVYYQNDDSNVPDINKTEKRIITYKVEY